jgi:FtsZ-binding cell division protein ZapB
MDSKCYDKLKAATDGIDKSNLPDNAKTALRGAANQLLFRLKRGIDTDKDLTQKFADFKKRQQDHAKEKQDIAKRIDALKGHVRTVLAAQQAAQKQFDAYRAAHKALKDPAFDKLSECVKAAVAGIRVDAKI